MKILFIGATGMLGKPVAAGLLKAGHTLTLFGRDENKIKALFPSAAIAKGDVFDRQSLQTAMQGQEAVYMNLSVTQNSRQKNLQPEREGLDNILAAAEQSGIQRLLYVSSLVHLYNTMNGYTWWAFSIKHSAVEKIKASGMAYTIFYPSTFMETYPYQMMQGKKIAMLGNSIMPMWFIAAEDFATQVANSFAIAGHESKEYTIQGPEAYTFDEANKIFINNYKKGRLKVMKAPMWLIKLFGNFSPKLNYAWHICEALNKYPEKFESEQSWKELGKPAITLAAFANRL
jgi:uncharacterized protein YbjT (DUF2867 family)